MDESYSAPVLAAGPRASIDALLDDQSGCWRRGERPPAEDFLDRRPGLRGDADAALDLIYHEILLRGRRGEHPTLDEYVRRFPRYAEQLRAHFEVHQALASDASEAPTAPEVAPAAGSWEAETPAVDGYEVLGEVGRGGNGVVYRARHAGLKRLTALKLLRGGPAADPREAARLRAEAQALRASAIRILSKSMKSVKRPGGPTSPWSSCPAAAWRRGCAAPQPARAAAALVETLARAVHAAHRAGVVHRDLKPANVLFAEDGTPKIADFGLAKRLDADDAQTHTGDILGTPSYMAPEQARGRNATVGPAADVYAWAPSCTSS